DPRGRARPQPVPNRAGEQDHDRGDPDPKEGSREAAHHRTVRVKGAVRTRPSTLHCRKSRHVPATGSSTPTRRTPGRVDRPVTRAPPNTLVQPDTPAEHTCVWK